MPTARKKLVSLTGTRYHHCISRRVCRTFLCDTDRVTGESYLYRRDWIEGKLLSIHGVYWKSRRAQGPIVLHFYIIPVYIGL